MYQATLTTARDITEAYIVHLDRVPALTRGFFNRLAAREGRKLRETLRREPPRPTYPLRWKSAKQRRYVMAKLRRENNLPYRRTHVLAQSWDIRVTFNRSGGTISAENPTDYAGFVYGPQQQPFHEDTGWPNADVALLEAQERFENKLIEGWHTLSDPLAGVPA